MASFRDLLNETKAQIREVDTAEGDDVAARIDVARLADIDGEATLALDGLSHGLPPAVR